MCVCVCVCVCVLVVCVHTNAKEIQSIASLYLQFYWVYKVHHYLKDQCLTKLGILALYCGINGF